MNVVRPLLAASLLGGAAVAGYVWSARPRVDQPKYPLPADDPRCPSGMAYIQAGTGRIWPDPEPEPERVGIYRLSARPEPHAVDMHIEAFCLDRNEVTVTDYAGCVRQGSCTVPGPVDHTGGKCNYGIVQRALHPINCITANDAEKYCKVHGKRLPLEEEWEYAAQGGDAHNRYPWGDSLDRVEDKACLERWTGHDGTCPVRSFPAESFGLFDMGGNVAEHTAHPCTTLRPCERDYLPASGGHWSSPEVEFSERGRVHGPDDEPATGIGFRCAR